MAIILTLLIEVTDSILAPMIVHFIINGSSVAMTYLLPYLLNELNRYGVNGESLGMDVETLNLSREAIWQSIGVFGFLSIFSLAIGGLLLIAIAKLEGRLELLRRPSFWAKGEEEEKGGGIVTIPLVAGMMICVFIIVTNLIANPL
jgi:hypothetical protein